jgi:TetR/AcrR family transcriptional regulator, cholesterol catabolism regulator
MAERSQPFMAAPPMVKGAGTSPNEPVQEEGDARQRILRAAEELFASGGFAGTSVQEIASAAGVNKALLYYYFADKQTLYDSLLADGKAAVTALIEEAVASPGTPEERLRRFIRGNCTLLWERSHLLRLFHREMVTNEGPCAGLREHFCHSGELLGGLVREGIAAGHFRPVRPEFAVRTLFAVMNSFFVMRVFTGEEAELEEIIAYVCDAYFHGVAA